MVRRYLDIEQVRLGDRLQFDVAIDADAWRAHVPSLLLQPLVENAVRHAVAPREEGGHVLLTARRLDDRLRLDGRGRRSRRRRVDCPRVEWNGHRPHQHTRAFAASLRQRAIPDARCECASAGCESRSTCHFMSDAPPPAAALRVLIVDDEPLARRGLRVRLEAMRDVEVIGEAVSGVDAIAAIETLRPDVVLLDIQMPGLDGFAVIDAIGAAEMPVTVFVTAFDAHAVKAFEAHALDYLLKPIDGERLVRAVERARVRVAERDAHARARPVDAMLAATAPDRRIVLRDRGRVLLLDHDDVDWIAAEGDYVRVYTAGRGHLFRNTMAAMEARLDPVRFARIHRSTIVNTSRVREIRPQGDRDYLVLLRDGTKLKMSRGYRDRLPRILGDAD